MPPQMLPDVVQQLGVRQRWVSETTSQYSSEVQQCARYSTLSSGVRPHSTRLNNAERELRPGMWCVSLSSMSVAS